MGPTKRVSKHFNKLSTERLVSKYYRYVRDATTMKPSDFKVCNIILSILRDRGITYIKEEISGAHIRPMTEEERQRAKEREEANRGSNSF